MKVKLLKKIRKRFKIIRVDKVGDNSTDSYKLYQTQFGLPFFVLVDNHLGAWDCFNRGYKTINRAKEKMVEIIKKDYASVVKSPKRQEKSEVVWWNNK